jgi:hypothetical protein
MKEPPFVMLVARSTASSIALIASLKVTAALLN